MSIRSRIAAVVVGCCVASLLAAPRQAVAGPKNRRAAEEHGEIGNGPPPWMTHGEEVRLAVVDNFLADGNTAMALDILRQMRVDGLDGPEVDLRQGIALRKDGVTSESERLLLLAQKRMKGDPRPHAELCILLADLQRLPEAIDQCREATRLSENDPVAWNNLSFLLLADSELDEALEAAEEAVRLDATVPLYRNNLGLVQAALGREDQAFRTLASTMGKADAAYMVGLAVERAAGLDAARPWYDKALQHDPNHVATRNHLAEPEADPVEPEPSEPTPTDLPEEP